MRTLHLPAVVLGAVRAFCASNIGVKPIPADTYCITYMSTYLAPATKQVSSLSSNKPDIDDSSPSTQHSGRLPFAPSIRPTFGNSTGTTAGSAISTDNWESSYLEVEATAAQSISGTLSSGLVTPTLTGDLSNHVDFTASTETTPISSDSIEPDVRIVIFLISIPDSQKRAMHKRETGGFVGNINPEVCTFAATFKLTQGQLFSGNVPIYYSGEDYKELFGQGRPPSGAITTNFTESGRFLAFENIDLPNGQAGFCQDAEGSVYITFIGGPPGCMPVNLMVYNIDQCQDGQLIGLDESTSTAPETANSGATRIESTTISSSATRMEGIATEGESSSSQLSSGDSSTNTAQPQSQSVVLTLQPPEFEVSKTSSFTSVESSTFLRPDNTTVSIPNDTTVTAFFTSTPTAPDESASTSQPSHETPDVADSATISTSKPEITTTSDVASGVDSKAETSAADVTKNTGIDTTESETRIASSTADADTDTTIELENTTTEAETTATASEVPLPSADQSCGNGGLGYAIYDHAFYNGDPPKFSSFNVDFFHDATPKFVGVTDRIGIPPGTDYRTSFSIYDDSPPFNLEYTAVSHRGFLFAPETGTYKVTVPNSDDITLVWFGDKALTLWTRENADLEQDFPGSPSTSFDIELDAGTYTPFRLLWANAQYDVNFIAEVEAPGGKVIVNGNGGDNQYFVQYACGGNSPIFPDF